MIINGVCHKRLYNWKVFFATTGVQEKLLGISTFKTQKRRLNSPIHPKHAQLW